jgi:ATP-dependent helicase/nuclease subunit A
VTDFTAEQLRAIERRDGSLLVRAGAGTGKTSVLVERFARAVVEDGVAVDAVLAITFTEKAAAELKARVRRRFLELGRRDLAREAERAWISTIHGFCSRVLRAHALAAGVDPGYRVLDELEAERVALDAFDGALEEFLHGAADPRRLEMVAAYSPDRLRDMVRTAYSRLRSQGQRRPALPEIEEPRECGEREAFLAAAREALAELGAVGEPSVRVRRAIEKLEGCEGLGPEEARLGGGAAALETGVCEEYERARAAFAELELVRRSWRDHTLLRELIALYGERYERLKRERSGLDFEDLELCARDLLRDQPGVREAYAGRFAHLMVDEFQDTNPLQSSILALLERDNLFRVGDENQSIYGFRNADVGVFREHHEAAAAAGRAESVTANFRARREVLDAVDLGFRRLWGERFEPLRADAEKGPPRVEPCVELLVVEGRRGAWGEDDLFGPTMRAASAWRACEARLLARRVDELLGEGGWSPGDVVLLLRATTHMTFYERALEERGIPTHVVGGRGYWGQQQVTDLRHWLSALANPLDELAIYSVLASPLVGASLDALALACLHARRARRDVWWALSEELPPDLPAEDRRKLERFVEIFSGERRAAPSVSLETLIDRAVTRTGYDRRVLAMPAGDRRMANVRKLMRVAREYEAGEGRDLRGFIDFVAERDMIQEREGEAPLEAEHLDAVRIMTVHRAKGLEFPVVCLADLGKSGREDYGALRVSEDGELGLRLATLGGASVDSAAMKQMRESQRERDEEEEQRIFYVAMTRAQEHLVLSGATDLERREEPKPLGEPMAWAWRVFCPSLPAEGVRGEHLDDWEGREVRVRWERCAPDTLGELLAVEDLQPAPPADEQGEVAETLFPPEVAAVPAPRALPVSRLSYSGLAGYGRCGYRFYLERGLRLPGGAALELDGPTPTLRSEERDPDSGDELPALLRGTVVHELLERLDFRRPVVPAADRVAAAIERHGAVVREEDVADVRALVEDFAASPLRERLARARRVRAELPFAFTLTPPDAGGRSLLVNGVVDVLADEGDRTLIVDYKSDRLEGAEPRDLVDEKYATQRIVYGLAALRAGARRVEVAHVLLERPAVPVIRELSAADGPALERALLDLADGVVSARFVPSDDPHLELCAGCPGQPALCVHGPERTLAARPAA